MNLTLFNARFFLNYLTNATSPLYRTSGTNYNYLNSTQRYIALAYTVEYDEATGEILRYTEPDPTTTKYERVQLTSGLFNSTGNWDADKGALETSTTKEIAFPTAEANYTQPIKYFLITSSSVVGSDKNTILYFGELQQTLQNWMVYGSGVTKKYKMDENDQTVYDPESSDIINEGMSIPAGTLDSFDPDLDYYYKGSDNIYSKINKTRVEYTYDAISQAAYDEAAQTSAPTLYTNEGGVYTLVENTDALDWSNVTYYTAVTVTKNVSPSAFDGYLYVGLPKRGLRYIQPEKYTKPVITAGSITISIR